MGTFYPHNVGYTFRYVNIPLCYSTNNDSAVPFLPTLKCGSQVDDDKYKCKGV